MTGILPIDKYSSGSELNMFLEYTMVSEEKFSGYFGFIEAEIDSLFEKYQNQGFFRENVTCEGLRIWYDGDHTKSEVCVYNPRSVVASLTNNNGHISVPNKELMDKFADMLQKEPSLGYVHQLASESERMLRATKAGDTETMIRILEMTHNTESPLLYYNSETELTMIVNMIYLSARDTCRVVQEKTLSIFYK